MSSAPLKCVVFMGSARDSVPAWGGTKRLGSRVLKYCLKQLEEHPNFEVTRVLDPVVDKLEVLEKPHFFYKPGEAPAQLEEMAKTISEADCYLIVTAEYNHNIPPGLANLLDYFGGSKYGYKPSGIVTYSPGQWGGMRAAMALRPVLAELGCLSVSALYGVAHATDAFDEEGNAKDDAFQKKMFWKMGVQLEWMGYAMKNHRDAVGLPKPYGV